MDQISPSHKNLIPTALSNTLCPSPRLYSVFFDTLYIFRIRQQSAKLCCLSTFKRDYCGLEGRRQVLREAGESGRGRGAVGRVVGGKIPEKGKGEVANAVDYNIQMRAWKQHFLFVLLLSAFAKSQVLSPVGYCLADCATCHPYDLTLCKGPAPCQKGHYDPKANGSCIPLPTLQTISSQLGQRTDGKALKPGGSWGSDSKVSTCEYASPTGRRTVDVLGLFSGVSMLERTWTVGGAGEFLELSFNLLRDEWLPFNDFMMVDISSQQTNLQSIEISYETRIKVESQPISLTCGGVRVMSEKFNIRIYNQQRVNGSLTALFTSFLYNSQWAITNIKLLQGCSQLTRYDAIRESCSICDSDAYLYRQGEAQWCKKCGQLCLSCGDSGQCLTCQPGASLGNGSCLFSEKYKTQVMEFSSTGEQCGGRGVFVGKPGTVVRSVQLKNENGQLFDQIQLVFTLFYDPAEWTQQSTAKIVIKANQVEIGSLTYKNMTNLGTMECSALLTNRSAVIHIVTRPILHNDNTLVVEWELVGKSSKMSFGVSSVSLKSLKKDNPKSKMQEAGKNGTNTTGNSVNVNASSGGAVNNPTVSVMPQEIFLNPNSNNESTAAKPSNSTNNSSSPNMTSPISSSTNGGNSSNNMTNPTVNSVQLPNNTNKSEPNAYITDTASNIIANVNNTPNIPNPINITSNTQPPSTNPQQQSVLISEPILITQPTIAPPTPSQQITPPLPPPLPVSESSTKITYIPASTQTKSGLQVVLKGVSLEGGSKLTARIDKLSQDQYTIDSIKQMDDSLLIFLTINTSFIDATLTLYRISTSRLLQTTKLQPIASARIDRFDALSTNQLASIYDFSILFVVLGWVTVVLSFLAILVGYGIVVEELVLSLQMVFLHVYIAADYLPLTFRDVVGGLSLLQNLNFLLPSHSRSVQDQWLGNVVQNGPIRFSLFNQDINFSRQMHPIIIANIVFLLWFAAAALLRRKLLAQADLAEQRGVLVRVVDNLSGRVVNFADQIWRYQFLSVVWCCFIQFYSFEYPQGSNRSAAFNAILCVSSFLCTLGWPIFTTLHCRKQYYENEYSEFLYKFEDIYYRRIPQYYLPSNHHRTGYPLLRPAKLFLSALVLAYLGPHPSPALIILILLHTGELAYCWHHEIFSDQQYFLFRVLENGLLVLIELFLLLLLNFSSFAGSDSYIYIGYLLSGFALLVAVNGLARVGYLGRRKYLEAVGEQFEQVQDLEKKKPKTERVV